MMRRLNSSAVVTGFFGMLCGSVVAVSAPAAFAQDSDQTAPVSVTEENPHHGTLMDEAVAIKPQVGVFDFNDSTGNQTLRGAVGLALELNFSRIVSGVSNNLYFGISTGGLYSHLGDVGSNFIGTSPGQTAGVGGANVILFPVDAKLGYNFSDNFRLSAHGGGNVLYNSIPGSMDISSNKTWNLYPNVGADLDILLTRNVELTFRPDETFTGGLDFFTGTIALGFALG
jgi:hypothetical protein